MATALRTRTREGLLVLSWWLANMAAVSIGLRFYQHYFLLPLPAVVLSAAVAIDRPIRWFIESRPAAWRGWLAFAASALAMSSPLAIQQRYFFEWSPRQHIGELYRGELFAESERIAAILSHRTAPEDSIFSFGSEPQIYFLAQRRCATRYAFVHPFTAAGPGPLRRQHEAFQSLSKGESATDAGRRGTHEPFDQT